MSDSIDNPASPANIRLIGLDEMLKKVSSSDHHSWTNLWSKVQKYCYVTCALEDEKIPWMFLCYINAFTRVRLVNGIPNKWLVERCDCWRNPRTDLPTETVDDLDFFLADKVIDIVQRNR